MDEELLRHFNALGATRDKNALLRACEENPLFLGSIPLPEACVSYDQALKDAVRERVILNGVQFHAPGDLLVQTLTALLEALIPCLRSPLDIEATARTILRRASRTTSGADSYYAMERLFSIPRMLLKPRRDGKLPPIRLDVFVEGGQLYSDVRCVNQYALIDIEDIEDSEGSDDGVDVWLCVDTMCVDQSNLSAHANRRWLQAHVYDSAVDDSTKLDLHVLNSPPPQLQSPASRRGSSTPESSRTSRRLSLPKSWSMFQLNDPEPITRPHSESYTQTPIHVQTHTHTQAHRRASLSWSLFSSIHIGDARVAQEGGGLATTSGAKHEAPPLPPLNPQMSKTV